MKKSKKGFTLIELLAVIVILAIIALIAVPVIMNILNKSNKSVFRDTAYGIINAGELYYAEQQLDLNGMSENKIFDLQADVNTEGGLQLKGEIPSGKVSVTTEGKVAISIHNGRYYAKKDYDESEVEVYEIMYYSTLKEAVNDVNNDKIGEKAISNGNDAKAGVYTDEHGDISIVLLKDSTEQKRISPSVDMTINLGGNTLSAEDGVVIDILSGNVAIDGRLDGSTIENSNTDDNAYLIQNRSESLDVNGGTYIANSENSYAAGIISGGELTINNVTMIVSSMNDRVVAIENKANGSTVIMNSRIITKNNVRYSYGIRNFGNTTIIDSDIKAYSNYNVENGEYVSYAYGILNNSDLTVNNSYVMGTLSGIVTSGGTLYIDGGTYEGFSHGGLYFGGTGTTSYVSNAIIRECDMPEGYTATISSNNAGFYIGENADSSYIKVYMDNNDIYGSSQPIVLRGTSGEQYNELYISNSKINTDKKIRIDNDTHKLYIGAGNNFTAANTNLPSAVEPTTDVYTRENFENK